MITDEEIDNYGLFKLPAEIRAKVLAGTGQTEEEYREKARGQIQQLREHAEMEARGETVHGWSTKKPNPGWSDDEIVGDFGD